MDSQGITSSRANQNAGKAQRLQSHKRKNLWFVLLTLIWLGLIGIGMSSLWEYQTTPGKVTQSVEDWPADSLLDRDLNRPTLVMFAHPHCPCTRASIGELSLIMAHCPDRVKTRVLFYKPSNFSAGWEKTDLWASAAAIPGVTVACDEAGFEAKKFRATTSGYVVLYDANGSLLFRGGITGSRGHSGDNVGRSAIEAILENRTAERKRTSVFGCPLLGQIDACSKENQKCLQQ